MVFYVLLLCFLVRWAACGNTPQLQWDPDTVEDCRAWYDNDGTESCEDTRKFYGITPEEFHAWNPSVGVDCKNWSNWQSYCIITQEKIDALPATTTISTTVLSTTTGVATSLVPSSTASDELRSGTSTTATQSTNGVQSSTSSNTVVQTGAAARKSCFIANVAHKVNLF